MAVIVRTQRPGTRFVKEAVAAPRRDRREPEAPDRGECCHEAPEGRAGRLAEAPDAGEGRMSHLEHEFTHGRSQS